MDGLVHIPVCFKGDGVHRMPLAATRAWIVDAIKNSWNVVSNVRFEGFSDCAGLNTSKQYVVAMLLDTQLTTGGGGGNASVGADGLRSPDSADRTLWMEATPTAQSRGRIEYIAVHEFGHVLGFDHEHERPGSPECVHDGNVQIQDPDALGITAYDEHSIMNYCNGEGNKSALLTDLDIEGVQAYYAPNPSADDDRDGIEDRYDNCPYASNHDQLDSNFEAEWAVQQQASYPSTDGHVPTPSDSQAYVDHWHQAYKGDACDPTPVARATFEPDSLFGGIVCPGNAPASKRVSFEGFRSSPIGARIAGESRAQAAFCKCELPSVAGQNLAIACANDEFARCTIADDSVFPPAPVPTQYRTMSTCGTPSPLEAYPALVAPAGTWGYASNPTTWQPWNSSHDASVFGVPAGSLQGIAWSHASSYSTQPYQPPPFPQTNLNNHYQPTADTTWPVPFTPAVLCTGCQFPWWTVSWRDIWTPPIFLIGTTPSFAKVPIYQYADGIKQAKPLFTNAALEALQFANTEVVPSLENTTGAIRGRVAVTGVLINANTGYLRGAFSVAPDERVAYQFAQGHSDANVPTPVRLFVASEGEAGTLYMVRGTNVIKQDVKSALELAPSLQFTAMTGDLPVNLKAGAWDGHTRNLHVLDTVSSGSGQRVRLVRIQEDGYAKRVWQSPVTSAGSMPTKYYLQTTTSGDLMVSISMATTSEWVLVDKNGKAKNAGTWPNALAAAPFISDSVIAAPFLRVGGTPQQGPLRIVSTDRARLAVGACATSWLKTFVPSVPCGDAWDGSTPATTGEFTCYNP